MRRRPRAAAALLLAICLLVYAARPFTGAATPGLPPRAPGSGGLRPLAEYTTPVYLPASGEARVSWQPPAVRLARGTMSQGAAFDAAVAAALGYYTEALPALPWFAVTDIRSEGGLQLVSVVGLENDDPEQGWNIEQGRWFGLVLLAPAKQGGWQGALQGTPAFSRLLTGVQLTGWSADARKGLDPLQRETHGEALIFPWRRGTSMQYVSGVHLNGFPAYTPSWLAVDFISDGQVKRGQADGSLLAAESGVIDWKCSPAWGEKTAAIRVGELMYTHLVNAGDLYVGRSLAQGELIGTLQAGSFDENCGVARQGDWQYHLHLGFPATRTLEIEGWVLNTRTHKFTRGDETRGVHSIFVARAGSPLTESAMGAADGVAGGGQGADAAPAHTWIWVDERGKVRW